MTVNLAQHIWKMSPHHSLCNAKLVYQIQGILFSSKCWWLWKEPVVMCSNEWRASNVTVSVQSDQLLRNYTLPVFFTINRLHSPPQSAEIQPMSQPAAGLVLDIHAAALCLRCGNVPALDRDCNGWPHVRTNELDCLTAKKLDYFVSGMCWCIVLLR